MKFFILTVAFAALSLLPVCSQVVINEFLTSNATVNTDPEFGEYADWVELYNNSGNVIDLSGYHLTDNISDTMKWSFPSGTSIDPWGFLMIWTDGTGSGLHTGFSLSRSGEELALYTNTGILVDAILYTEQQVDISQGRMNDGSDTWSYFRMPTPGASNNNSIAYSGFTLHEPVFSSSGGFFDAPLSINIANLDQVGQIYYTTDGSYPTEASFVYNTPIDINETTVVRARLIAENMIPGPVVTNTYFINEGFETRKLPVLSLSTNPEYFWDADIGIYVQDFKPDWEYPIHLEFYENDGLLGFHHEAGVRLDGENAWILPQKLLAISSRKQYESGSIDYQVFPKLSRTAFDDLALRCSGNDWSNTFFRDAMQQGLTVPNCNLDIEDYRPCIVFLNGVYLGLHNIRPKEDEDYLFEKYGYDKDSVDIIVNDGEIDAGDDARYLEMTTLLDNGVQTDPAFEALSNIMDIGNFTDYIISEIFCANTSWGHNISCWSARSDTSRFRWFLHDFDRGFDMNNVGTTAMEFFTATNGASWSNPAWATLPLRKMLQNNDYKLQFVSRFADHLYTTYHPVTISRRVNEYHDRIVNEMPIQIARWAGTTSSYGDAIPSFAFWENEVSALHQYGIARNNYLYQNLDNFFGLNGISPLQLSVSANEHGTIRLHDIEITDYPWSGSYFNQLPIRLIAEPKAGHQFLHWEQYSLTQTDLITAGSSWKYYDGTTAPPQNWSIAGFNDATWSTGPAQLGYGEGDEATVLSYGPNPNNKTPAYYFRYSLNVDNTAGFTGLKLRMVVDDGAVVYINGTEVVRYNMPSGPIDFNTYAASVISSGAESAWNEFEIPASALQDGENTIAVSVHQIDGSSSDISFDLSLSALSTSPGSIYSTVPVIDFELMNEGLSLKAVFEPTGECFLPDTIFSNLTLYAACSPYYAQGDVVIPAGVSVTIEPGVEIRMPQDAAMWIHGHIVAFGNADYPIVFTKTAAATEWGGLFFVHTNETSVLQYVTIEKASAGTYRIYYPAAISMLDGALNMNHVTITDVFDNPIFTRQSDIVMINSTIHSTVTGDCINVKQGYGFIQYCEFYGDDEVDMDAIDYDGVIQGVVKDCIIHDFRGENNDGMDIGEQSEDLLIANNLIYNCVDKGISVGQESTTTIKDNTIVNCALGIALKDRSIASIDHNTIHNTGTAVSAYEKNPGYRGGTGFVTNTIASNSWEKSFFADTTSMLEISYCIDDTDPISGANNSYTNPLFQLPNSLQFQLQNSSPAIGAASDGADIGTGVFKDYNGQPGVILSEIYYNDTESGEAEFLEIYNPGSESVDLTGYQLSDAVEFIFPSGTVLLPQQYMVIAENESYYSGGGYPVLQWDDGQLSNSGERILLTDQDGLIVDFVRYGVAAPWPDSTVTDGKSLELVSADLDNHFHSSWQLSNNSGGSPGSDAVVTSVDIIPVPEVLLYPNPAAGLMEILVKYDLEENSYIEIVSVSGQVVQKQNILPQSGISRSIIDTAPLAKGIYFLIVASESGRVIWTGSFERM